MNVVFVSDDAKKAEAFKRELAKCGSAIQVILSPNALDAMLRLGTPGVCDAVVLDTTLSGEDTLNLVSFIRKDKKPVGIVALMGPDEKEFPSDLLKSGVDHFVLKRPGYGAALPEMLQQLRDRYHAEAPPRRRQVRLLYAGEIETAQRYLANVSQLKLEPAQMTPDGKWQLPETAAPAADALVMDFAVTGAQTLKAIKEAAQQLPDVPIILLTNPGDDETVVHAMRTGAADCLAKSGNYFHRLLLVLQREIARRELIRERTALRSREERLRHIVESMPAGVTVIAPDGGFMAINDTGLKLIGAVRLDQVVGKNVAELTPQEDRERILAFVSTVCNGTGGSARASWKGLDGNILPVELRAVPMRRDAGGSTAALVVLYPDAEGRNDSQEKKRLEEAAEELQEGRVEQELKWEAALQESESKRVAAEEQQEILKKALEDAEARHKLLLEQQRAEHESWEQARQGFQEQCLKIEEVSQSLRSAQAGLIESHSTEQAQWNLQRQELEQKRQAAEQQIAELSEALQKERSDWDLLRQELEQKWRAAEENRATLETALRSAESSLETHLQEREALLAEHGTARTDFEQKYRTAEEQRTALETALHNAELKTAQLTETHGAELAQRDLACRELETKLQAAEQQNASLQSALQNDQSSLLQLTDKHNAELSQREVLYRESEQKLQAAEERRIALETALRESEAGAAQLVEKYNTEISRHGSAYRDLEQKCLAAESQAAALQTALQDSESRVAQLVEKQNAEISRRDRASRELEQKCLALEKQIPLLQSALQDAKSSHERLEEKHKSELSRHDSARQELEQKSQAAEAQIAALQAALQNSRSSLAQMAEAHNSELSRRDLAYRELEQKLQLSEKQIKTLQSGHASLEQVTEAHQAELAGRDLAQKELESKFQASEKQRLALQNTLQETESRLAQLIEKHSTELSQRDFSQKKSEQKYQAAEKQRIALEDALHDAEAKLAHETEKYNGERAQWDLVRQGLEQKCEAAEKQQAIALQNAARETESRLAWISEQNQAKAIQLEQMQQEIEQLKSECQRLTTASSDFHLRNQRLSRFTSVGVVLARRDGQVLECNDAAARIFGYASAEEALAQTGPDQFRIYAFEGPLDARLQQDGKLENIEWSSLGRDGSLIRVQENATLVESPAGDGPLVERILTDISRMHKLSEEVRRAHRMESTGDLAAATVKSLKELCASLAHSGELLMKSRGDSDAVKQLAESLLGDANRGVKHARQFLSVALKADRTPALLNINDILVSNDTLLHSLVGEDIDLQTVLAPRIGLVSADRNEIIQLIGSLLASSREVLPLGGTVTIETSNIEIDSLTSGCPAGLKPGIYVGMMFSADGCAVQPERRVGSNRTLVERMGGSMEIVNDPKLGTVHRVYLPRVEACAGRKVTLSNTANA